MYVFFPYVKMTNIKYVKILLFNTFCITRKAGLLALRQLRHKTAASGEYMQ